MNMKRLFWALFMPCAPLVMNGQADTNHSLWKGLEYKIEFQSSVSDGKTPLWLNANKQGLSSIENTNGYLRAGLGRDLENDKNKTWGVGYGLDVVLPYHYTSNWIVQQAFAEVRWKKGTLTAGSKEYPMELKNNRLSSGSQTLGINARPVPQVRLALPEYWTMPFANGWLHLKGHIAYGKTTDGNWQEDFTQKKTKYGEDILYHTKAGYLKIGKEDGKHPLSVELGLEMASQFGGTVHRIESGEMKTYKNATGLQAYWDAFMPGGSDTNESLYQNVAGNQLGSWLMRINYDTEKWKLGVYADHFFEDHSAMFMLEYDGYGHGDEWNVKKDKRYLLYDLKDIMLGAELNLKQGTWLKNIVLEYIYTKYQSGPIFHDHSHNLSDHIGGRDDYYNHALFCGWQHWGQVMGNPLYLSPLYNGNGEIRIADNRFFAWHLGIGGQPASNLRYRFLATFQKGFGTYFNPFTKPHHNVSFLLEADYKLKNNWSVKGGCGTDTGGIMGHNYGIQLSIIKTGTL